MALTNPPAWEDLRRVGRERQGPRQIKNYALETGSEFKAFRKRLKLKLPREYVKRPQQILPDLESFHARELPY